MEINVIPHSKPTLNQLDIDSVINVLQSNHLEDGGNVRELESYFCNYYDKKFAIAVSNGFAAIHLSLLALGVQKGDEVILPSYSCAALLNPVLILGASPIIVDIESDSYNMSIIEVEKRISKKTKAIIVPHIFGIPARIDELKRLNIPIIEDCAQSVGNYYKNKKIGSYGDISIFSFYATKMLTGGDGGLILCDNEVYNNIILNYKYYGHKRMHKYQAYNYQTNNIQAALVLSQMKRIDDFVQKRKELAQYYDSNLAICSELSVNYQNKEYSCFYRYPVTLHSKKLEFVKDKLYELGIGTGYGVLEGNHQLLDRSNKDFPNTFYKLNHTISIPIYPSLDKKDIDYISENLIKILKQ